MQKKIQCFVMAACILLAASMAGAEETQMVSGTVIEVNPVSSTVVISYRNAEANALLNMELYVPENAILKGGAQTISLDDVQVSDRVEIEFSGDPMDNPMVERLIDLDRTTLEVD
ncbi:MAG: hypothetical protein KKD29_00620 [Candidatus Omnitrophica bacterium]|nr:hypothetical protein [Candidatus Omnitrophota bacterium]MBU4488682.1 hypothetical protein [Candidatus Omnitrophota bacterium]MCG2704805.1 hypothetical protein [Candidatus Omnitrophota bacterium]